MDETKRFLRYVVPGILFGSETALFLWILLPNWTGTHLGPFVSDASLGSALVGVLASGSLGYVIATVHHWLHWRSPTDQHIIDHSAQIAALRRRGLLRAPALPPEDPRREALETMTVEWFQRNEDSCPIGNATNRAASLSDLAHASGTARVASLLALLTAFLVYVLVGVRAPTIGATIRLLAVILLGSSLVMLLHDNYRRTGRIAQRFYDAVLESALENEQHSDVGSPR